jgi:hypothetical protein
MVAPVTVAQRQIDLSGFSLGDDPTGDGVAVAEAARDELDIDVAG